LAVGKRNEESLACYDYALTLRSDIRQIRNNRGNALRDLDRLDEAEESIREALRLKPGFANAHCNLGIVLDYLGRFEEAEASYRTALRLQPEARECRGGLGEAILLAGKFEEGWKEFGQRWLAERLAGQRPLLGVPAWNGEAIGDRVILLLADDGLGDAPQFCRYMPQVAAGAGRTILAVQALLKRLLSQLPGISEIISICGAG
jgi:tetratricopeptide (TPR) repeat protein